MARLLAWAVRAGRGRWLALALLAAVSIPLAFDQFSPFGRARSVLFDFYQSALPRARQSAPAMVVAIDDAALRKLGQWPWPRIRLASLIDRIGRQGALAIGLDILMPERDQASPEALAERLQPDQQELRDKLQHLTGYDALLAQSMRRYRVVLGAAGSDAAAQVPAIALRVWPIVTPSDQQSLRLRTYPGVLQSLPELQAAASGQALLNVDLERGIVRRISLVGTIDTTPLPTLALELLRVAMGVPAIELQAAHGRLASVRVGELRIPTQSNGDVWLHFGPLAAERYVSAADVFDARFDPLAFKNKIVIIALASTGIDVKTTPRGELVPGAEVHAQLIESFFDGRFLHRPEWMPRVELAIFLALGGVLIWITPGLRRDPAILLSAGMLLLVLACGLGLFHWRGLLFDAAGVIIALTSVSSSLIAIALVRADRERRAVAHSLQIARESAARVAGELEAARRIQLGILPNASTSFPGEKRFELAAELEPARAVGGDLYDFFMLDADRLFVTVGDVSGKGIPASLLMSITKALTKSIALRPGGNSAEVLSQANIEVSRDNPESQFVTAFAAVLDARTGLLRYWTAGHDTPFLRDASGVRQIDRALSGPPLCVLEHFEYHEQQLQLEPRDTLTLFTDGITEAENPSGEQFGKERLAGCLRRLPGEASASTMLAALRVELAQFVGSAQPSDDLTVLVVRWLGPGSAVNAP